MSELLSNIDLIYLCKNLGIKLNGVIFKDGLADLKDGGYIINLDATESTGTHWVCCYKKGQVIVYFDSFGENCFEELKSIADQNSYKIIESMFQLQNLNDDSCGWYCLAFLYWTTQWIKSRRLASSPALTSQPLNTHCINLFNDMFKTDRTQSNKNILSKYIRSVVLKKPKKISI
jgi:hypothetical protein